MNNLIKQNELNFDYSNNLLNASRTVYEHIRVELIKDFPEKYSIFINSIAKQYENEYKLTFEGYEVFGLIIGFAGSNFSVQERTFVEIVLTPVLKQYLSNKGDEAWVWIKKMILYPKISAQAPSFAKRAMIPLLLDKLKKENNDPYKQEAKKFLLKLLRIKKRLTCASDIIFYNICNNVDLYKSDDLLEFIKVDSQKYQIPDNVFVVILLFHLMKRGNIEAENIFFNFLSNEKYFIRDVYIYNTLNHFQIIEDNVELQEKILKKFIENKIWKESSKDSTLIKDLRNAFEFFILAKAKKTNGDLNFLNNYITIYTSKELINVFISSMVKLIDKYPIETFKFIKKFLEETDKPEDLIEDSNARQEIVSLAESLAEKSMGKEALWIIEKFINDPDPRIDEKDEFNYHNKIINGESTIIITSVRGKIAWALQKLAVKEEYINDAFNLIIELLNTDNLYVIQQAIIPLIEIAARLQWLIKVNPKAMEKLHDIVFDLLDKYSKYRPIAIYLIDIFRQYRSLSEEDALKILKRLGSVDKSADLFLYYAIYRKRHFKEKGNFDSTKFEKLLKDKIEENDEKWNDYLSWYYMKFLKEYSKEFEKNKIFIKMLSNRPYSRGVHLSLLQIIENNDEIDIGDCFNILSNMVKQIQKYILRDNKDAQLSICEHFAPVIQKIAKKGSPDQYIKSVEIITELARKDKIYMYDLSDIFEAHKYVEPRLSEKKFEQLKKLYQELISIKPFIKEVDFLSH